MTGGDIVPFDGGSTGDVDQELAQIGEVMRTDRRRYDKDQGMRARYRDLLAKQSGTPAASDADLAPSPPDHVRNDLLASHLGQGIAAQWDKAGFSAMAQRMQAAARDMVSGIADRGEFLASFDALPAEARHAVMAELASGSRKQHPRVSDQGVKNFASTPEGKELVAAWGHLAPQKVRAIRARLWSVIDKLPDAEADEFLGWIDRIPSNEMKIILNQLAR